MTSPDETILDQIFSLPSTPPPPQSYLLANFALTLAKDRSVKDFQISTDYDKINVTVESDTIQNYTFRCNETSTTIDHLIPEEDSNLFCLINTELQHRPEDVEERLRRDITGDDPSFFRWIRLMSLVTLNKELLQRLIAVNVLSPFIHEVSYVESGNNEVLLEAMSKFEATILTHQPAGDDRRKFGWVLGRNPLVVQRNHDLHFLETVKFIFWAPKTDSASTFRRLSDLKDRTELLKNFYCPLAQRSISLDELVQMEPGIEDVVTPDDLVQIVVGRQRTAPHIERQISRNIVDVRYLQEVDDDTVVIINNAAALRERLRRSYETSFGRGALSNLYLLDKECSKHDFYTVSRRGKCHLFDASTGVLEWLKSIGGVSDLEPYRVGHYWTSEITPRKITIVAGSAGSGKTTFLKSLKDTAVYLSPQDVSTFCRTKSFDFLSGLKKCLLEMSLRSCGNTFLWDGLDGLTHKQLVFLAGYIKNSDQNRHFVSCGTDMKLQLQGLFGVLAQTLRGFTEEEKDFYLRERLNDDRAVTVANEFVLAPEEFVGVPLQLFLLTAVVDKLQEVFSITDLLGAYADTKFEKDRQMALATKRLQKSHQKGGQLPDVPTTLLDYFTAVYLVQNPSKKTLFEAKHTNVRFFFDLLLANKSRSHVGVLYRNYSKETEESGGRDTLHLMCAWGRRCPPPRVVGESDRYVVTEESTTLDEDSPEYKESLCYLLDRCDLTKKDAIFNMAPLDFAESSESLFATLKLRTIFGSKSPLTVVTCLYNSVKYGHYKSGLFPPTKPIRIMKDVTALKPQTDSLLHLAVRHRRLDSLKQLLSTQPHKDDLNYRGVKRQAPLHLSAKTPDSFLLSECLLVHGAAVDPIDEYGRTPLSYAAEVGNNLLIPLLIRLGAEMNGTTKSPLTYACANGHVTTVKLLLQSGASIADHAPVAYAAANGRLEIVKLLHSFGADLNTSLDGCSPLYYATRNGHNDVITFLLTEGVHVTTCGESLFRTNPDTLELLLTYGVDVNTTDSCGWSILHYACDRGHAPTARLLVSSGADVNLTDHGGSTPLALASQGGHLEIVTLLVQSGANVNSKDESGCTPLYYSSKKGHCEVVDVLIKAGSGVDVCGTDGWSAVLDAAARGHEEVVKLLVAAGAEFDLESEVGRLAVQYASDKGRDDILEFLRGSPQNRC